MCGGEAWVKVTACSRYFLVLVFPNSFSKLGVKHEITEYDLYLGDVCQRQACGKVPYFLDFFPPSNRSRTTHTSAAEQN